MSDSHLTVYNQRHHNCETVGELHGLADAMRGELLRRIENLETELHDEKADCGRADSRVLELEAQLREAVGW